MSDNEQRVVAARLREARESLGLTQGEVSGALQIPRTSVHAIEVGKRGVSALELRRLARLYRRRVEWLLGEDEAPVAAADGALYRATQDLSADDKEQVLRFAQFLAAGSVPRGARPGSGGKRP
ncbi:helix-turn-helix domain-containing protein [uncultured Cellulomonas sp.]|uniref:helix-turn-helix domain-containing protein n=1 Tax=uncultured Cellulomonas sp. TaxID=189682 RepID=UPI00345BD364